MVFFRWFVGLPLAAIITAGLFAMMAGLIRQDVIDVEPPKQLPDISIHSKLGPTDPDPEIPKPDRLPDNLPETEIDLPDRTEVPGPRNVLPDTEVTPPDEGPDTERFAPPDIRYAPQYPENCRSKNAEGYVTVQFDVTPEGSVVNARVIESANSCFNRTVIATVSKWKYPPSTRGGRATMRYGLVEVFHFQLED